jgi:hypothetical protein
VTPALVALSTTPSGAALEIDGRPVGHSPTLTELEPGSHRLRATAIGFVPAERALRVARGSRVAVHLPLVRESPAPPEVPADASEGSASPTAGSGEDRSTPSGPAGRPEQQRSPGVPRFGLLSVSSEPWAQITIDGRPTGLTTPAAGIRLAAGNHTVELVNSVVGARKRFTVRIGPGESVRRMMKLR